MTLSMRKKTLWKYLFDTEAMYEATLIEQSEIPYQK